MRVGTRGSRLALAQAGLVADALRAAGVEEVEVVEVVTSGDRDRAREDKAKWVRELERALLDGTVDVAVHSAKDVPSVMPDGLELVGCLPREDPRDVVVGALSGRVGTASPRRAAMVRAFVDGAEPVELRGNVDTRLRKLADGEVDGLLLAAAGLRRLGREDMVTEALDWTPAAGQGVVVLQARAGFDGSLVRDEAAWRALTVEREVVAALDADCHSAVGAHFDGRVVRGWVGAEDGSRWVAHEAASAGELVDGLLRAGAGELIGT